MKALSLGIAACLAIGLAMACDGSLLVSKQADVAGSQPLASVKTPVATPASGTYPPSQQVSLSSETAGATLYYASTSDGSDPPDPMASSSAYSAPLTPPSGASVWKLKVVAVKPGMASSSILLMTYVVDANAVAAPSFTLGPGSYETDQSVGLTCSTSGAVIHFTTDGSTPTASSPTGPLPISVAGDETSMTIKAMASKAGMSDSAVVSAAYAIHYPRAEAPVWGSVFPGSYSDDQSVSLTTPTSGASIRYTTNGATPTSSSTLYTTPIAVAGNGTVVSIKAIALKAGMKDSPITVGSFTINYSQVSSPQFSVPEGVYTANQTVALTCATAAATIHYTTDGSTPTAASATTPLSIPVSGDGTSLTIKAIAVKSGMADSPVATATYVIASGITITLSPPTAAAIVFGGTQLSVLKGQTMTITASLGAQSYAWYLDFDGAASSSGSYTVATASLGYGIHWITLVATKDGVKYSGSLSFQVTH